jgi:SAM-dependent methyltransferase
VSRSSRLCAAFIPPLRVARALDLGTGSGLLALQMARHAEHVVATDVSEAAIDAARDAAARDGVRNLELRRGSWLEPVAGERFGLVVCNPPYAIAPEVMLLYRDSGRADDGLSRMLLAALPSLLEDGGYGVLQGNWIHAPDEPWWRPPARDLAGSGCDAWLCRLGTWDAESYAAEWDTDVAAQGIEAVTAATVVVRRRPEARNWRLALTVRGFPEGLGERLPALAAVHERLGELAGTPLRRAPGLEIAGDELVLPATFEVRRPVPGPLAGVVRALDGATPLRELTTDVAALAPLVKLGFVEFATG